MVSIDDRNLAPGTTYIVSLRGGRNASPAMVSLPSCPTPCAKDIAGVNIGVGFLYDGDPKPSASRDTNLKTLAMCQDPRLEHYHGT